MAKFPTNSEEEFRKFLVKEYFKNQSVENVFSDFDYELPISYAQYQRVLSDWGVVKSVGPNSKLSEAIDFLSHLAKDNIDFPRLYEAMSPKLKTSSKTFYRVLSYIKEGLTRRVGVALVITPYDNQEKILLANDITTPNLELGKRFGNISLPMGYSAKKESRKINIKRVLQHEVFTKKVIDKKISYDFIPDDISPFMYLDIADIRVSVYHLTLPKNLSSINSFSSYKLKNYKFLTIHDAETYDIGALRSGVMEAILGYKKHLSFVKRNLKVNPIQEKSVLNRTLAEVSVEVEE